MTAAIKLHSDGPPAAQGEPSPDAFYTWIGASLSRWEDLEFSIAMLFPSLITRDLNSRSFQICRRSLGRIENSSTRSDIVCAAVEAFFEFTDDPNGAAPVAKRLFQEIGVLRGFRNKLAHGVVRNYSDESGRYGWWLMSSAYETKRWDSYNGEMWHVSLAQVRDFHQMADNAFGGVVDLQFEIMRLLSDSGPPPR